MDLFLKFKKKLLELYYLKSVLAILEWDKRTYTPSQGFPLRVSIITYLTKLLHQKFLSSEFENLLIKLKEKEEKLSFEQKAILREIWRNFSREKKLPLKFIEELTKVTSRAYKVWVKAKEKSDFKLFSPYLKKIIALKIKEAKLVGFQESPYDALLETYEPYLTSKKTSSIFEELKNFLLPFIEKITHSKIKINPKILEGNFDIERQKEFNKRLAKELGFNFKAGRLDETVSPFENALHSQDVRIAIRYDKNNLFYALTSIVHETGHGLYEQSILKENFGTPLAEAVSYGIHESQSLIWQNFIFKNKFFWQYFYSKLQKEFPLPFSKINLEGFYKTLNYVKPSLSRVKADEVTYNLHIILRFEIEKDLIEEKIKVEDLPEIWNAKIKKYLKIEVPNDKNGVLQDVHWVIGSIGYFPSYTLGTLYASQFYQAAKKEILSLEEEIEKGNFKIFREWLKNNIHIYGKLYTAEELVKKVTGEELNIKYFIDYLTKKYSQIYGI